MGVTARGLSEAFAAIDKLPATVTAALKGVAKDTADRVAANAKANLRRQTHGTGATAESIHVSEDIEDKRYVVSCPGAPHPTIAVHYMKRSGRIHTQAVTQNNLPIWLEYGTRHMAARPFMRPAGDAESQQYRRDMRTAANAAIEKLLK